MLKRTSVFATLRRCTTRDVFVPRKRERFGPKGKGLVVPKWEKENVGRNLSECIMLIKFCWKGIFLSRSNLTWQKNWWACEFLIVAVTNYPKLGGLKQPRFIIFQFRSPTWVLWAESGKSAGPHSCWGLRRESGSCLVQPVEAAWIPGRTASSTRRRRRPAEPFSLAIILPLTPLPPSCPVKWLLWSCWVHQLIQDNLVVLRSQNWQP